MRCYCVCKYRLFARQPSILALPPISSLFDLLFRMGFFSGCWEALLQFASYTQSTGLLDHVGQQPLGLPQHEYPHATAGSLGPVFPPQDAENHFQCDYSAMVGYKHFNSASNPLYWLRPASSKNVTYDIHTDYEEIGPVRVAREVMLLTDGTR